MRYIFLAIIFVLIANKRSKIRRVIHVFFSFNLYLLIYIPYVFFWKEIFLKNKKYKKVNVVLDTWIWGGGLKNGKFIAWISLCAQEKKRKLELYVFFLVEKGSNFYALLCLGIRNYRRWTWRIVHCSFSRWGLLTSQSLCSSKSENN